MVPGQGRRWEVWREGSGTFLRAQTCLKCFLKWPRGEQALRWGTHSFQVWGWLVLANMNHVLRQWGVYPVHHSLFKHAMETGWSVRVMVVRGKHHCGSCATPVSPWWLLPGAWLILLLGYFFFGAWNIWFFFFSAHTTHTHTPSVRKQMNTRWKRRMPYLKHNPSTSLSLSLLSSYTHRSSNG